MVGIVQVFGFALLILLGASPGRARAGELTVEVAAGTLSVHAVDAPLADVLAAIGQRARARILIESVLEDQVGKERITASFAGLAMDEGLRRLLKHRNFILGFSAAGVDEIRVYIDGRTGFRDLTASKREPSKIERTPPRWQRTAEAPPPEDRAKLARLRHVTLTSRDPTARLEALEELSQTEDTGYLLEAVIEALARERDAKVLEGLVDIVRDRGPIPAGPLRTLVTSDRDGSARAQALELLVEHAGDDQGTRTLLQTLSRNDPSEHVRDTASTLLDDLQTPRPPRALQPDTRKAR
jgi:hypothetical protein